MKKLVLVAALCALFPSVTPAAAMPICGSAKRVNCVVDGDTVWINREKIRIANIDAPEMGPPRCSGPAREATASRDYLARLLDGDVTIIREGQDRYGRTLAKLVVGGRDVGGLMIAAGLAQPYRRGAGAWC